MLKGTAIVFYILFFGFLSSFSQCPDRYTYEQFTVDSLEYVYADSFTATVYYPSGDTEQNRALIFLIHGGGFVEGSRHSEANKARAFTRRGFVTVVMDYFKFNHCFFCSGCDDPSPLNTVYLNQVNKNLIVGLINGFAYDTLRIDTNQIWIYGWSVGAGLANSLNYQDSARTFTNFPTIAAATGWSEINRRATGLIIHSGRGEDTSLANYDLPQVSFWDSGDINDIDTIMCLGIVNGPRAVSAKVQEAGECVRVFTGTQGNHTSHSDSFIVDQASCFIWETMCGLCMSGEFIDSTGSGYMCSMPLYLSEVQFEEKYFEPDQDVTIYSLEGKELYQGNRKWFDGRGTFLIKQHYNWFIYIIY